MNQFIHRRRPREVEADLRRIKTMAIFTYGNVLKRNAGRNEEIRPSTHASESGADRVAGRASLPGRQTGSPH